MLSTIQQQKLERLFEVHDTNGNGYVEQDDYEQMIARIADGRGWVEGSKQHTELRARALAQWAAISAGEDPPGSAQVPLPGWLALWNAILQTDAYEQRVRGISELLWETMDRDGSGHITRDESRIWFDYYAVSNDDADRAFAACDLNGDGYISRDEWLVLVDQFFYSMNPADPGTLLFGPLEGDDA